MCVKKACLCCRAKLRIIYDTKYTGVRKNAKKTMDGHRSRMNIYDGVIRSSKQGQRKHTGSKAQTQGNAWQRKHTGSKAQTHDKQGQCKHTGSKAQTHDNAWQRTRMTSPVRATYYRIGARPYRFNAVLMSCPCRGRIFKLQTAVELCAPYRGDGNMIVRSYVGVNPYAILCAPFRGNAHIAQSTHAWQAGATTYARQAL